MTRDESVSRFYRLIEELADRTSGRMLLTDPELARHCPRAGLYFFFENGELRPNGEPRVVRIGTHALTPTSKSTLWGRLHQHMGSIGGSKPGGGNHRGSIFRRHVGSALLAKRGDTDVLASWMASQPLAGYHSAEDAVELEVSLIIRAMPFLWLNVPTRPDGTSERGFLERNLIALISTMAGCTEGPSPAWLGFHAAAAKVRSSSLWNVNHVDEQFNPSVLDVLPAYVRSTPRRPPA